MPQAVKPNPTSLPSEDPELHPYVISAEIGKGSFATVYRGYHETTREQVAVKSVSRSILTTKLFENLQSEIDILKRMSHPHVTQLIDIIRAEKYIYLVMEFCAGGDLSIYIKKRGKIDGLTYVPSPGAAPIFYPHPKAGGLHEIAVRAFLRQLARALKFLRYHNLIHRDIKPQNLLLTPPSDEELAKGHPVGIPLLKLADFGFARVLPQAHLAETLCGSPLYMAPEILRYQKYDAKADLWSVGAVLYEMSVGRPPFRAQNHVELLKRIEHARSTVKFPDEDPTSANPDALAVPADIKALIRSLLKNQSHERVDYEEFFKSKALENSRFRKHSKRKDVKASTTASLDEETAQPEQPSNKEPWVYNPDDRIPEAHRVIPPEVLDPKARFPSSQFNFRRKSGSRVSRDALTEANLGTKPDSPSAAQYAERRISQQGPKSPKGSPLRSPLELTDEPEEEPRDYVLVDDTPSIEFNRRVDEIQGYRFAPNRRKLPPSPLGGQVKDLPPPESGLPSSPPAYPPPSTVHNATPSPDANGINAAPSGRSALNALSRALSRTSRKLWGENPPNGNGTRKASQERPRDEESSAEEDSILSQLEDLAQKTQVVSKWCDGVYNALKKTQQTHPSARRFRTAEQAELTPLACINIYMLLVSFAQRAIESIANYQNHIRFTEGREDVALSEGFDDALSWFRALYETCMDRILYLKTLLPQKFDPEGQNARTLIYNRGVELSRAAARKELLDQMLTDNECEKLYEDALWCLYTVRDDIGQQSERDNGDLAYAVTRTKLRLHRCRLRMKMNDKERLQDARADHNLDDVQRFPPPWEAARPQR